MRILLTGTSGQLGHALLQTLDSIGTVIVPERRTMDLSQPEQLRQVIRTIQPDLIVNPAAYTAVDKAESEPELAHTINATAPAVMAEEAKKLGAALIHYSTDYVFDGSKCDAAGNLLPYAEQDPTAPINVYGQTKLAGEQAIRQSGCRHLIFRTSWVYSLFGKNFLLTMLRLAKEREELNIVNDQWGAPTSAGWLAEASASIIAQIIHAADQDQWWEQHQGLYHMTPQGKTSWCGFTQEIMAQAGKLALFSKTAPVVTGIPASQYPTPARRPVNSCLDTHLLAQHFGLAIPTWQAVLENCLQRQPQNNHHSGKYN
ncbi:dTDP-4-dehydrorhamnose reductase [Undibacterium sp. Jales W-56]|uniref:dTDP-4-dehydrorhamnose reductase n=1 Tax=Undibacterium sp. Jales W-56 TaxID=2897325 RepID=UPI0021D3CA5E|nr:dTDP-4-dehydrorhamnose reductase [Undibacterium sp. Jales W-56]MCU6434595.1 dTDP-4-dehydrorhamnose reductase [Undibacterium sp. Jales W-56]